MTTLSPEVAAAVQKWLELDVDESTRAEISKLAEAGNDAQLRSLLLSGRMTFGTAGLRSAMGAGYTRMNQVTVAQSACGLAAYLRKRFTESDCQTRGVVLGYDGRHNSKRFAQITASVMLAAGIRTRLTRTLCPTPWVAFGTRHFNCIAGVVVTASHNPKADNGYKVYWEKGSQIIPPHDAGIAAAIEESLNLDKSVCFGEGYLAAEDPLDAIEEAYFSGLRDMTLPYRHVVDQASIPIVYTAMHGVGGRPILVALKELTGVKAENLHIVEEQFHPDPEFPTVVFPNPEEGKTSLDLSLKKATETSSVLIVANDPDADRLAIVERQQNGTFKLFTGNELGALLGWWMLHEAKERGDDLSKCIMLSSTVSSCVLATMAAKEGFQFEDTLTGFKWMGSRATLAEETRGLKPLFAFEEAIGFMCGGRVRDKDGITAAAVAVTLASWVRINLGRSLTQQLDAIYHEYGYHRAVTSYVISRKPAVTAQMFNDIRHAGPDGGYPKQIGGVDVLHVRDLGLAYDSREPDGKPTLPTDATAPVLTFYLAGNTKLTIRGSGTEPKLKWYCEVIAATQAEAESTGDRILAATVAELIRPAVYGFELRPTA